MPPAGLGLGLGLGEIPVGLGLELGDDIPGDVLLGVVLGLGLVVAGVP